MYKVSWTLSYKHTTDGYFYKSKQFHSSYKFVHDYYDAKELVEKLNNATTLLGLGHLAEVTMEKEPGFADDDYGMF
jgi:hypothetical protein